MNKVKKNFRSDIQKNPRKSTCTFPDLTAFLVDSELELGETTKVSYTNEGIRQVVWVPKHFVSDLVGQ
jgi:hypothetical protein